MSEPLTVADAVLKSSLYLRDRGVDSPRLDAELLLAHVLGWDRLKIYLNWDMALNAPEIERMREVLRRRGHGREPLARVIGQREFYGRPFRVGQNAFVPRPETEWLVERACGLIRSGPPSRNHLVEGIEPSRPLTPADPLSLPIDPPSPWHVVDIGTGTGCVAISIAIENPDALGVARDNASTLAASDRVRFHRGDLFAGLEGPFHIVVSNPPYIPSGDIAGLPPEVATHDPRAALDGGPTGLEFVERLVKEAIPRMVEGGHFLLELGEDQSERVADLLRRSGCFDSVRTDHDLAGIERYVKAVRNMMPPPVV